MKFGSFVPALSKLALGTVLAVAVPLAGAQSLRDIKFPRQPLVLKAQGSFYVGGREIHTDYTGWPDTGFTQYAEGEITVDQMYFQFQVPLTFKKRLPVVFVHGCCLSSKTWETTPDGRMGWYEYFTRRGHPTFLGEQAGRARSGFDPTRFNQVRAGVLPPTGQPPILMATAQFAWGVFRFGPSFGEWWPDSQFPQNAVSEMYKQVIPDLFLTLVPDLFAELGNPDTNLPTVQHMATLAKDLGGAILVGHSQSSGFPTKAALKDPSGVRGIIGLETGCFGNLTPEQVKVLARIPILVIEGDHYGDVPKPPASCATEQEQIRAAGGHFTYIHLPALGIRGNTHMFMQDRNNLQVADIILRWIDKHVDKRRSYHSHWHQRHGKNHFGWDDRDDGHREARN